MTFPVALLDLILAITLLEWLVLVLRKRWTGRGMGLYSVSLSLVPGLLLMRAARLAAPAEVPVPVFLCFIAAGVFHACDFFRRSRLADAASALGDGTA